MTKIAGLTGGVASGKSVVRKFFVQLGARAVDADEIAHQNMRKGEQVYFKLIEEFGRDIVGSDGEIDRRLLGKVVFSNEGARKKINRITHPAIMKEVLRRIDEYRKKSSRVVLLEAALLIEEGFVNYFKPLIVVWCRKHQQLDRLMMRDGLTVWEAEQRLSSQMPLTEKVKLADFTIDNSGSLEDTYKQVKNVWEILSVGEG